MNPEQLKDIFLSFIEKNNLKDKHLILGVSGGVDSCVLLDVVAKSFPQNKITVAHVNHNTRKECFEEQQFVEDLCKKYDVEFCTFTLQLTPEKNREAFWREERKKFFNSVQKSNSFAHLLTAHHATDLVETMIFRLTKGTSIDGLHPFDISTKPFWEVPKSTILEYARLHNLKWYEDQSNQDLSLQRNRIRHKVLPELEHITPDIEKVFVREAKHFAEAHDFISSEYKNIFQEKTSILLDDFLTLHSILQKYHLRAISNFTCSSKQIDECLKWLKNTPTGNTYKDLGTVTLKYKKGLLEWK